MCSVESTKGGQFPRLCRNLKDLPLHTFPWLLWPGAERPGDRAEKLYLPRGTHVVGKHVQTHAAAPACLPCPLVGCAAENPGCAGGLEACRCPCARGPPRLGDNLGTSSECLHALLTYSHVLSYHFLRFARNLDKCVSHLPKALFP